MALEVSMTLESDLCVTALKRVLTGDGRVTWTDLCELAENWLN